MAFTRNKRRAIDPLLPLRLLRRRVFLGGNFTWLLACMTSWGAVFFLAVTLQTTLGQTPMAAGLLLAPIYVVMMVGSPLIGRMTDRIGPTWPTWPTWVARVSMTTTPCSAITTDVEIQRLEATPEGTIGQLVEHRERSLDARRPRPSVIGIVRGHILMVGSNWWSRDVVEFVRGDPSTRDLGAVDCHLQSVRGVHASA